MKTPQITNAIIHYTHLNADPSSSSACGPPHTDRCSSPVVTDSGSFASYDNHRRRADWALPNADTVHSRPQPHSRRASTDRSRTTIVGRRSCDCRLRHHCR